MLHNIKNIHCANENLSEKFQLTNIRLGGGSFGQVFLAIDKKSGQKVAVKLLQKEKNTDNKKQIQIHQLIQSLSTSSECWHSKILGFFGTYHYNNSHALALQYFGESLQDYLKKTKCIDIIHATRLFLKIAEALCPIHLMGIIHRDLKPSNILIQEDQGKEGQYRVKICDFGLAEVVGCGKKIYLNQHIGTSSFHSPQIQKLKQYSEKSDIWSLGVIFYILIYKKMPFPKQIYQDSHKLSDFLIQNPVRFKSIPQQIVQIGDSCLSLHPQKRPSTFQIVQKLDKFLTNLEQKGQVEFSLKTKSSKKEQTNSKNLITADRKWSDQQTKSQEKLVFPTQYTTRRKQVYNKAKQKLEVLKQSSHLFKNIGKILESNLAQSQNFDENRINFGAECKNLTKCLGKLKIICEFSNTKAQIFSQYKQFEMTSILLSLLEANILGISGKYSQANKVLKFEVEREQMPQNERIEYYMQMKKKVMKIGK